MKKSTTLGVGAMVALIAVLALLGLSAPAQGYPEGTFELKVDRQTVYSGESFTATGSSSMHCSWRLEWDHKVRQGESTKGSDFVTSFKAPPVKSTTQIPLHGTCTYDAGQTPNARAESTVERTIMITVEPRRTEVSAPGHASAPGHGSNAQFGRGGSELANTGGPNLLFLAGGLALLLAGATAVSVARRRAEEAEIQASGA